MALIRKISDDKTVLTEDVSCSKFTRWAGGILFPLILAGYSIYAMIAREAIVLARGQHVVLKGKAAVGLAIAYIGLALLMHVYFKWTISRKLYRHAKPVMAIAFLFFLLASAYVYYIIF